MVKALRISTMYTRRTSLPLPRALEYGASCNLEARATRHYRARPIATYGIGIGDAALGEDAE